MERKEAIKIARKYLIVGFADPRNFEEFNEALSLLISIAERVDVIKIKDVLNTTCLECKFVLQECVFTCSILAQTITQYLEGE
jgi:hypothetical protein